MPFTGWKSPSANSVFATHDEAWQNTTNAYASNDSATGTGTVGKDIRTDQQLFTGFGFGTGDVPSGATITGIEVSIEVGIGGSTPSPPPLMSAWVHKSGGTISSEKTADWSATADTIRLFGGTGDVWSLTVNDSDVRNSNFGVVYQVESTAGNQHNDATDHIQIRVEYTTGGGTTFDRAAAISSASTLVAAATLDTGASPAFNVQHVAPYDVPSGGGTRSITAVSSLTSAIALLNNNRPIGGGPDGSAVNIEVDEISLGARLTGTSTVTLDREAAASVTNRASVSVWEYIGASGGDNEFIVRDRRSITLSASNSATFTASGISDQESVIPFITGIRHDGTSSGDHDHLTACTEINRTTGEVTVYGRGGTGTAVIEVATVEFTGSNWTVAYGSTTSDADTGTVTISSGVSDWSEALIVHQFWKGDSFNIAIADVQATYAPGASTTQVDWAFHSDHDGNTDQRHTIYALHNAGMNVTRYSDTDSSDGNVNIDITSAGLSDINEALIWVSSSSSGGGTAHARGVRNAQITSTTNAQHYCHRSGNTVAVELQVVELPQDAAASGTTYDRAAVIASASSAASSASITRGRDAAIASASNLVALAGVTRSRDAAIVSASTLAVARQVLRGRTAAVAGQSSAAGVASITRGRAASVSAQSTIAANAQSTFARAASVSSASTIGATAGRILARSAGVASESTMTADSAVREQNNRSVAIEAASSLDVSATRTLARSVVIDSSSVYSATPTRTLNRSATAQSNSALSATRAVSGSILRAAAFAASSAASVQFSRTIRRSFTVSSQSSAASQRSVARIARTSMIGTSQISAQAIVVFPGGRWTPAAPNAEVWTEAETTPATWEASVPNNETWVPTAPNGEDWVQDKGWIFENGAWDDLSFWDDGAQWRDGPLWLEQ